MSRYGRRESRWLGPALGAGFGTGLAASGFGEFAPVGVKFGGWLGNMIKTATGFGEYEVRSNALYEGAQVPFVANRPTINGTTISHREYIMDVVTSATPGEFKSNTFDINPAQGSTFEWLSQIAANYEEYVLEGCLFVFRSMSADALSSTNTALGTVMMATQYNLYQPIFTNKAEMENHAYSMSVKPSEDCIHPIECDPHQSSITTFFTRPGTVPTGADQRLYDVGRFEIATTGFQAASVNIGELHVTYQVSLMKPRLYTALGRSTPFFHAVSFGTWSNAAPFGPLPLNVTATSSMAPTITYTVGSGYTDMFITLPPQASPIIFKFCTMLDVGGSGIQIVNRDVFALTNCTNLTSGYCPTVSGGVYDASETARANLQHAAFWYVKCTGLYTSPVIQYRCYDVAALVSVGRADFYIQQMPTF